MKSINLKGIIGDFTKNYMGRRNALFLSAKEGKILELSQETNSSGDSLPFAEMLIEEIENDTF